MKAKDLDKMFDAGNDITRYLDYSKARRPEQEQKRVNVDFPIWMIHSLDKEAHRLGVPRQSFIKVWINLNEFDNSLKLSSWLYRIVHNETVSFCRKKKSYGKNNKVIIDENIDLAYDNALVDDVDVEDNYLITDNILNSLPLKYKEVLVLKFLEKMSYEEISDVLKIPEGTVGVRINRAKKMFKKLAAKNI